MLQVLDIELNIIAMYITRQTTVNQHFEVTAENLACINFLGLNKLFMLTYKDGRYIILKPQEVKDFILFELSKVDLSRARKAYKAFKELV